MKVDLPKKKLKFDETAVQDILKKENEFITKLWDVLSIAYSHREQIDDDMYLLSDKEDKTEDNAKKVRIFKPGEGTKQTTRAKSLEELFARHNALKGNKKLKYKDKLLKKGLKHKITKKKRKQERKMKKNSLVPKKSAIEFSVEGERKIRPVKPVFNSEGKMVFSKFDFSGSDSMGREGPKGSQNPKHLLEKLQKQKQKLQKLESEGKGELAMQIREKEAWKKALKKAQGEKVRDDPELLKKSLRKIKEQKMHSKKKWDERLAFKEKSKQDKQKKRTENILKRKMEIKKKKLKKASKKGRVFLKS